MADAPPPRLHGLARFVLSLGHPSRLTIFQLLSQEGALSYREIEAMTGLSNPTVRQHLKILRRVGVVERGPVPLGSIAARCGRKPHTHILGEAVVGLHREIDYFLWEPRDPDVGRLGGTSALPRLDQSVDRTARLAPAQAALGKVEGVGQ